MSPGGPNPSKIMPMSTHATLRRGWLLLVAVFAVYSVISFFHQVHEAHRLGGFDDFGTVYAAARCWIQGENPYLESNVSGAFRDAGGPSYIPSGQQSRPSVYFITAMPVFSSVAWLPWNRAKWFWFALSLAAFFASTLVICSRLPLSLTGRIFVASLAIVCCRPFLIGLSFGNPSVVAIGILIVSADLALRHRYLAAGILLGLALSIKPQIAAALFAAFLIRRLWTPLLAATAMVGLTAIVGVLRAGSFSVLLRWLDTQRQNVTMSLAPGNINDARFDSPFGYQLLNLQTLVSIFFRNAALANALTFLICAAVTAAYVWMRRRLPGVSLWTDLGLFSVVLLMAAYHRNYDIATLIVLLPWVIAGFRSAYRWTAAAASVCLLLLFGGSSLVVITMLASDQTNGSIVQALLLRHQALLVAVLGVMLVALPSPDQASLHGTT